MRFPLSPPEDLSPEQKLRLAFHLQEATEAMVRLNLLRRFPGLDEEELTRRVDEWRLQRRETDIGDAAGRPGTWPRS